MFKRAFPLTLAGLLLAGCQSTATDTSATTLTPTQENEQARQRALYEVLMTRVPNSKKILRIVLLLE